LLDPDLPAEQAKSLHKSYKKTEKIGDSQNKFLNDEMMAVKRF
jgi:hypothetical protein